LVNYYYYYYYYGTTVFSFAGFELKPRSAQLVLGMIYRLIGLAEGVWGREAACPEVV